MVVEPVFQSSINTYMKKILTQYLWIFLTVFTLAVISISMLSKEKNPLEELEEKIKKVEQKEIILTENEKKLEQKSNEKDWEEVDKNSTK